MVDPNQGELEPFQDQELAQNHIHHLGSTQNPIFGQKLKIYVKMTYSEQFLFYGQKFIVNHFWDFIL